MEMASLGTKFDDKIAVFLTSIVLALIVGLCVRKFSSIILVREKQATRTGTPKEDALLVPRPSAATSQSSSSATNTATNDTKKANFSVDDSKNALPVVDVWAERRKRGILPASLNHKAGVGTGKPFSSSYYFAHNNPNTSGGYKDGLRMEDFTMNEPRLLSKGGKPIVQATTTMPVNSSNDAPLPCNESGPTPIPTAKLVSSQRRRSLAITQYLWDDDDGSTGTIIIERLPGGLRSTDQPLLWAEVNVLDVQASLFNNDRGLRLEIETSLDWDYHLEISPLFATAVKVQTVRKAKRLRVKIVKKSTSMIMSSYEKWPHAHKKKT